MLPIMDARNENPAAVELTTDQRINVAIRAAAPKRGITVTELHRHLGIPYSSWQRKISDRPGYHQKYSADEVVRIAAALGLTANDLVYGSPVLGSTEK